jgi:hypothetical protein
MEPIHNSWNELAKDIVLIIFACGTIAIALKFTTFFNQWVYFAPYPNIFDTIFLIVAVSYLVINARRRK